MKKFWFRGAAGVFVLITALVACSAGGGSVTAPFVIQPAPGASSPAGGTAIESSAVVSVLSQSTLTFAVLNGYSLALGLPATTVAANTTASLVLSLAPSAGISALRSSRFARSASSGTTTVPIYAAFTFSSPITLKAFASLRVGLPEIGRAHV